LWTRNLFVQNQVADECGEYDEREAMALVHLRLRLKAQFYLVVDFSLCQELHRAEEWVEVVGIKGDVLYYYQTLSD
jgi:hypothetical protein